MLSDCLNLILNSICTALAGTDTNNIFDVVNKNLTITVITGADFFDNSLNNLL